MPNLASVGRFIAQNPGAATGISAGLGAGANVAREALSGGPDKHYLGAAIKGGLAGAAVGGAGHGLARAARDTMLLRPELTGAKDIVRGTLQRAGEGVSNFAQRQVHGLTGYGSKNPAYLDQIGIGGGNTALRKNRLVNLRAEDLAHHNPAKAESIFADAASTARGNAEEGALGDRFRQLGMTSAPGSVKAFVQNPREASKAVWSQLRGGGALGTAMGVGGSVVAPIGMGAASIAKGDESAHGGQTVGEKVLRTGAGVGTGLMFGGLPIASNMIIGGVGDAAAGRLGRAITPRRPAVADVAPRIG